MIEDTLHALQPVAATVGVLLLADPEDAGRVEEMLTPQMAEVLIRGRTSKEDLAHAVSAAL